MVDYQSFIHFGACQLPARELPSTHLCRRHQNRFVEGENPTYLGSFQSTGKGSVESVQFLKESLSLFLELMDNVLCTAIALSSWIALANSF